MKTFIAFDLGAGSGRAAVGRLADGKLSMEEIHRFPNEIIHEGEHLYWDIEALFGNIVEGLRKAAEAGIEPDAVGIDTWGVDVAFFGADGKLLGNPYCYRDPQTEGIPEKFFSEVLSREELYARTGIQVMNFNTLFQLYSLSLRDDRMLREAKRILFLPDALTYMLSGAEVTEYTIASTSHFLDPRAKVLDRDLLEKIGVSPDLFAPVVMPGTKVGCIKDEIADKCGLRRGIPVIAVAGHDTGSAVAAVPAQDENFAYISSGTWSLMGVETKQPILTPEAAAANITNEGGVEGTTRFLKNITGMWIVENLLREWRDQGFVYSYQQMTAMARSAAPARSHINPDDASFAAPANMQKAIDDYLSAKGLPALVTHSDYLRCVFESLALRYKEVMEMIKSLSPVKIDRLHVIGGGSRNELLNDFTREALGIPVIAGPTEATAAGNLMMQAYGLGAVSSLQEMRKIIADSIENI